MALNETIASGARPLPRRRRWWRRVALWRAIAGMGLALAVGAVIVSAEFSATLAHRTSYLNRRIASLNNSVHHLRQRVSSAERKSRTDEEKTKADELLKRVLAARDLRTIKLTAVAPAIVSIHPDAPVPAAATLASSVSEGASILQVGGLATLPEHQEYAVWWVGKRGHWALAGQFQVEPDGKATVPLTTAPKSMASMLVTVEQDAGDPPAAPMGPPVLRSIASR
ncbi:MAG: anti-sigma factor domain-containing protein [Candidatus Binataceae bacterium]